MLNDIITIEIERTKLLKIRSVLIRQKAEFAASAKDCERLAAEEDTGDAMGVSGTLRTASETYQRKAEDVRDLLDALDSGRV